MSCPTFPLKSAWLNILPAKEFFVTWRILNTLLAVCHNYFRDISQFFPQSVEDLPLLKINWSSSQGDTHSSLDCSTWIATLEIFRWMGGAATPTTYSTHLGQAQPRLVAGSSWPGSPVLKAYKDTADTQLAPDLASSQPPASRLAVISHGLWWLIKLRLVMISFINHHN